MKKAKYNRFGLRRKDRYLLVALVILTWILVCVTIHIYVTFDDELDVALDRPDLLYDSDGWTSTTRHDRWIVVTTVNKPTQSLIALSKIPGWFMVVVGDRKTPPGWSLPNVVYLDIEEQNQLGYNVLKYLPQNSYARKTIGYLYAIQHGARVIYETDDDNAPFDSLQRFIYGDFTGLVSSDNLTCNPYVHFGHSSLWPRGYPLEYVSHPDDHAQCMSLLARPAIQQGLVNGDPDVDAIYRLVNKPNGRKLDLTFDQHAPPLVLPGGTYSPYNSQNTLFQYEAFWSLLLPVTTSMRVCDIWRSYWAQRLLGLTGAQLAFLPPTAYQVRNVHSYLNDADEETPLYLKSGALLRFLKGWQCTSHKDLYGCMRELTATMVKHNFWKETEIYLLNAWLSDLEKIRYRPPGLTDSKDRNSHKLQCSVKLHFHPVEQPLRYTPNINQQAQSASHHTRQHFLLEKCHNVAQLNLQSSHSPEAFSSTLLMIVLNRDTSRITELDSWYRPHFPYILYCTKEKVDQDVVSDWKVSVAIVANDKTDAQSSNNIVYSCLQHAVKLFPKVTGYLVQNDNVLLNVEQIKTYSKQQIWVTDIKQKDRSVQNCDNGRLKKASFVNPIHASKCFMDTEKIDITNALSKIVFYIPHKSTGALRRTVREFLLQTDLHLSVDDAVVLTLRCASDLYPVKCLTPSVFSSALLSPSMASAFDYLVLIGSNRLSFKNLDVQKYMCQRLVVPI